VNPLSDPPPRRWLPPSEALNHFKPPPGVLAGTPAARRQSTRYGLRLGDFGLLIERNTTSELLEPTPIYPLPGAPEGLQGLINLRGNLAPVFNLKQILGLDQDREGRNELPWLVVLDQGENAVCFYIDGWPQAVVMERALDRSPPLPPRLRPYVSTAYLQEGRVWLEFNHRHFFRTLAGHPTLDNPPTNA